MNPSGYRGPPPSFKTNVNRAKTKRWVEAKSYSYDGDDWGDADDFDEYDGYGEPEAAASAGTRAPDPSGMHSDMSHHNAPPSRAQDPVAQGRTNSFGPGTEHQAFSGPQPRQTAYAQYQPEQGGPSLSRPQQDHPSQGPPPQGHPAYGQYQQQPRRPSVDSHGRPVPSGPAGYGLPPRQGTGSRSHSMTSNTSGSESHRRDFSSASAMPPALQPLRPPRKSSLSQQEGLAVDTSDAALVSPLTEASENATAPQDSRERSASGSTPVFVRPADIYRRMHEEKERERLSQESSRPSLDAINASRDESPAKSGDEDAQKRKTRLEPVAERRSEYGMDGLLANNRPAQKPPSRSPNGSPMLPDLKGLGSSFGDDFGASFMDPSDRSAQTNKPSERSQTGKAVEKAKAVEGGSRSENLTSSTLSPQSKEPLQHQPSRGFRSAVHSAFDQPIRQKSSASESVGRSNSDSTNAISPIITRPGSAHNEAEHFPMIPEEPTYGSRGSRESFSTMRPFGEDGKRNSQGSIPGFIPGHRRDMNTPSPDNSPARTPVLEKNSQLRNPQEVELDLTTPVTTESNASSEETGATESTPKNTRASKDLPELPTVAKVQPGSGPSTPRSRSESPTKGRVRDIADKLEGRSSPGSSSPTKDHLKPREDSSARSEAFRPHIPGGWASYATSISSQQKEQPLEQPKAEPSKPDQPKAESRVVSAIQDPFSAAAAAGSALAGALVSAVGVDQKANQPEEGTSKRAGVVHPEAQRVVTSGDDDASSVAPTPLDTTAAGSERNSQYFAPVAPLKQRELRSPSGKTLPSLPPQPVEALSIENSPNDQESDRLRKELVRELSPQAESFRHKSLSPSTPKMEEPRLSTATQESTALPQEYDSYWNGSPNAATISPQVSQVAASSTWPKASPNISPPQDQAPFGSIQTANTAQPGNVKNAPGPDAELAKHMLQQRFSWETPLENSTPRNAPASENVIDPRDEVSSAAIDPEHSTEHPSAEFETETSATPQRTNKELPEAPASDLTTDARPPNSIITNQPAVSFPAPSEGVQNEDVLHEPVAREVMPGGPLPPAPYTHQQKIPNFKEIMSTRSPDERIDRLNAAREMVANEDTGLETWLTQMAQQFEEHADLLKSGGVPNRVGATAVNRATPGPSTPSGPSPASARARPAINTGKAKDILTSSGVLGGKSKAKELFAKGRSKFRSSGSEKVDN